MFIVTETQALLQTPRPLRRFRVMLQSQNCDCGEYQAKNLSCSHVMTNLSILIPRTMCRYYLLYIISFGLVSHELNEGDQWGIQGKRGVQRVIRFQIAFPLKWIKKLNEILEKNMEYVSNKIITEKIILTYIHF